MDFRHLKYFVAVAQERSFTRAAERLYISQPPLSRQIQQLEEELGLLLFDREARPLALTEAGRFFYGRAVRMLEQLDETIAMTRRLSQVERRLVVDLLTTNETYFFREPQHFRFLAQWLARRSGPLRCWSAARSARCRPSSRYSSPCHDTTWANRSP